MIHIVMVEPEIPQNAGNVVRLAACTGAVLHLIKPLGFKLEDKYLKRAGLDYWDMAEVIVHESIEEFMSQHQGAKMYFASTKAGLRYDRADYGGDTYVLFGPETRGLSEKLIGDNYDRAVRIPMREGARSLNLANSIAIVVYEALRQGDFDGLMEGGSLTRG